LPNSPAENSSPWAVDFTVKVGPYVDQGAFPATPIVSFWSSTAALTPGTAWLLKSDGTTTTDVVVQSYNVRCVH
jgi:hypothetical protein